MTETIQEYDCGERPRGVSAMTGSVQIVGDPFQGGGMGGDGQVNGLGKEKRP